MREKKDLETHDPESDVKDKWSLEFLVVTRQIKFK